MTTGTYALYARTGAALFAGAGLGLLALLAVMWALVAGYTVRHSVRSLSLQEAGPAPALSRGGAEAA
jgi:hypothetical protein